MKNIRFHFPLVTAGVIFIAAISYGFMVDQQPAAADSNAAKSAGQTSGADSGATPVANASSAASLAPKDDSNCYTCHSKLSGRLQVLPGTWAADTHHSAGISCAKCHGGDGTKNITMANYGSFEQTHGTAFVRKPSRTDQPAYCGSCHENGPYMRQFKKDAVVNINAVHAASAHGKALFEKGNLSSASCVDCHGAHGAMKGTEVTSLTYPKNIANMCGTCHANEAYMKASLPEGEDFVNHIEPYLTSVHANGLYKKNDLGSPTCNDCHSNHGDYLEGTANVFEACNTCHAGNATMFAAGPHKAAYQERGLNGCVGCHGSPNGHNVAEWGHEKVGIQQGAVCLNCHNPDPESAGNQDSTGAFDKKKYATNQRALGNAIKLHSYLTGMDSSYHAAKDFFEAQEKGGGYAKDDLELLEELKRQMDAARTAHHVVWADSFKVQMAEGLALSDSVSRRTQTLKAEIAGRQTIIVVVGIFVFGLVVTLGAQAAGRRKIPEYKSDFDESFYTRTPPDRR